MRQVPTILTKTTHALFVPVHREAVPILDPSAYGFGPLSSTCAEELGGRDWGRSRLHDFSPEQILAPVQQPG